MHRAESLLNSSWAGVRKRRAYTRAPFVLRVPFVARLFVVAGREDRSFIMHDSRRRLGDCRSSLRARAAMTTTRRECGRTCWTRPSRLCSDALSAKSHDLFRPPLRVIASSPIPRIVNIFLSSAASHYAIERFPTLRNQVYQRSNLSVSIGGSSFTKSSGRVIFLPSI